MLMGLLAEPFWSPVGSGGATGRGNVCATGLAAGDAAGEADGEAAGLTAGDGDGESDTAGEGDGAAGAGDVAGFAGAVVGAAGAAVGAAGAADWHAAMASTITAVIDRTRSCIFEQLPVNRSGYDTDTRTSSFLERLRAAAERNTSWLCVGLDPDPELLPGGVGLQDFLRGIVESTSDLVCCYKPNLAFFEALGLEGQSALRALLGWIPAEIPVLIDAKRGDTPQTMRAYARAIFDELDADAVTVSPYLGGDSVAPFFAYPDRGVFVLCKTSNPGAAEMQDLLVEGSEPLFARVARRALSWDQHGTLGLVVGATYPEDVARVRAIAPDVPILLPGVGPQAGDLERSVQAAVDHAGGGALVNLSRSLLYASRGADWQTAARAAGERARAAINAARSSGATASR
jgi:orotidine-5'-phosphate decarboxylase